MHPNAQTIEDFPEPVSLSSIFTDPSYIRVEEAIKEGKLGGAKAGVEDIIVGGMHSLMIDEAGRVGRYSRHELSADVGVSSGPGVSTMEALSVDEPTRFPLLPPQTQ